MQLSPSNKETRHGLFSSHFKLMLKRIKNLCQDSPSYLIVAAMVLHLILTVSIYLTGRLAISPIVDEKGLVTTIAPDSLAYLPQVETTAETLTRTGVGAWLIAPVNMHVKLYSLSIAIFGLPLGSNILSAEPLNLCYYLAILFLVFKIGTEVFDQQIGLIAAVVVALWPSFLLHTTQFLKDPLFAATVLTLILIIVYWLARTLSWRRSLILVAIGLVAIWVLCFSRSGLWGALLLPITIVGVVLLAFRQWKEKRLLAANLVCAILVLAFSIIVPVLTKEAGAYRAGIEAMEITHLYENLNKLDFVAVQIGLLREGFVTTYNNPGSNIDTDIKFSSAADLFRYLPRAIEIGYLAPFPNMWLSSGNQSGRLGRAMSGLEMLVMYVVELLALVGLWRSRARLSVWLLAYVTFIGITALGLVVVNVGALYRMRYTFFILIIILGASGLKQVLLNLKNKVYLVKPSVPISI